MSDPARLAAGTQRGVTIAVAALALLGAALVWHATTAGAGIENDSVGYAQMAAQLRSGQTVSSTHFPPGLPIVWAVAANPYAVSRVLNLLALAALVAITGAAVWQSTRRPFPTLFAAAMVAVSQPLLAAHAEALSEPLMLVLASAGLWLTLVALADDRPRSWCAAGLSLGLAAIVRYAAVVYPAAAVLCVLLERRWRRAALLAGVSALPLTLWLARNLLVTHAPTDRSIVYHPIRGVVFRVGRDGVAGWLDPLGTIVGRFPATAWLAIPAVALLFGWGIWRGGRLARLASFFAVGYILFQLLVIAYLDGGATLEPRYLVPVFVAAVWTAAALLSRILDTLSEDAGRFPPLWLVRSAVAFACLLVLAHGRVGLQYASRIHRAGIGSTSESWRHSTLVAAVNALQPGTGVWTNADLPLSLLTRAQIHRLPSPVMYSTRLPWPGYATAVANIPNGAYVADFRKIGRTIRGAVELLARTRGLDTLARAPDGAFYRVR